MAARELPGFKLAAFDEATAPSLLDTDQYKLTMMQFEWFLHPEVPVDWAFLNRTKSVRLPAFVPLDDLQRRLNKLQLLRFSRDDIDFLHDDESTRGLFRDEFLRYLLGFRLPPIKARVSDDGSTFVIRPSGRAPEAGYAETFVMNVVNRPYFIALRELAGMDEQDVWMEGQRRLDAKMDILEQHPEILFICFCTRRRYSPLWHEHVLRELMQRVPQNLLGTSNLYLAKKLGLAARGTLAHQEDMFFQGIYHDEDDAAGRLVSHEYLLRDWWNFYGERLAISLPDTYGSDYFFKHFTPEQARSWLGARDDSGDTIQNGENFIAFCEGLGIRSTTKKFLPSDGLQLPKMIDIYQHLGSRLKISYGWGTDEGNDMGFDPISIVVKLARVNGHDVGKLSNNIDKATGTPETVARLKRLAGYNSTFTEACRF